MQGFEKVKVLLVERSDYKTFIGSPYGLDRAIYEEYDVIIDRESKKILKAVFHRE